MREGYTQTVVVLKRFNLRIAPWRVGNKCCGLAPSNAAALDSAPPVIQPAVMCIAAFQEPQCSGRKARVLS